jgi:hypothetical protein
VVARCRDKEIAHGYHTRVAVDREAFLKPIVCND